MDVMFGFISASDTFRATIPDHLPLVPESTAAFEDDQGQSELAWLPEAAFRRLQLRLRTHASTPEGDVEICEYAADPRVLSLTWPRGGGHFHVQVPPGELASEADRIQLLMRQLSVSVDARGVPRARHAAGMLGRPGAREASDREHVHFVSEDAEASLSSVRFRNDSALGRDEVTTTDGSKVVTRTSEFGVTVCVTGTASQGNELERTADVIVTSLSRV